MNYQKIYNDLITGRQRKILTEGYTERHHIIPRCMGGDDNKENLVDLSASEHFVAHQLLVKIYPKNEKLIYAAHMMTFGNSTQKRNNKLYGWIRSRLSEQASIRMSGEGNPMFGKKLSVEHRRKIGIAGMGRVVSEETRRKLSDAGKARVGRTVSEETRQKMSEGKQGHIVSEETRQKMRKAHLGKALGPHQVVSCPFCPKCGGNSVMQRWHFNNCKNAPQ